jgi:Tfp pilus assembly pilus retraction ATPase PilT
VLDQHLLRPKEEAEHKATFSDAVRGLEAVRKYIRRSDTKNNTTVIHNKAEYELHTMRSQEQEKQKIDWWNKYCNYI